MLAVRMEPMLPQVQILAGLAVVANLMRRTTLGA
jgi:hypothetical protein